MKYFDDEYKFYYMLSILSVITLGLMKAIMGRELWYTFFIILPGMNYLQYLKQPQIKKNIQYNSNLYVSK